MMKIDFSGLESRVSVPGGTSNELLSGFSTAPEFQIPNTDNVCFCFLYTFRFCFNYYCYLLFFFIVTLDGRIYLCLDVELEFLIDLKFWGFSQFDGFQKEAIQMVKPAKGTTTLAFIFKEGVIVAADSRASMGGYICKLCVFVYYIVNS